MPRNFVMTLIYALCDAHVLLTWRMS